MPPNDPTGVTDKMGEQFTRSANSLFDTFIGDGEVDQYESSYEARFHQALVEGRPDIAEAIVREYVESDMSSEMQKLFETLGPEGTQTLIKDLVENSQTIFDSYNTQEVNRSDAVRKASEQFANNVTNLAYQQNSIEVNNLSAMSGAYNMLGMVGVFVQALGPALGLSPEITAMAGTWVEQAEKYAQEASDKEGVVNTDTPAFADIINPTVYDSERMRDSASDTAQQGQFAVEDAVDTGRENYSANLDETAENAENAVNSGGSPPTQQLQPNF